VSCGPQKGQCIADHLRVIFEDRDLGLEFLLRVNVRRWSEEHNSLLERFPPRLVRHGLLDWQPG